MIKKNIEYYGIDKPSTPTEVALEIAGLELAVLKAKEKIAILEQSKILAKLEMENMGKRND